MVWNRMLYSCTHMAIVGIEVNNQTPVSFCCNYIIQIHERFRVDQEETVSCATEDCVRDVIGRRRFDRC